MNIRHPTWCEWQVDNLFVYEAFDRAMKGSPFPKPDDEKPAKEPPA